MSESFQVPHRMLFMKAIVRMNVVVSNRRNHKGSIDVKRGYEFVDYEMIRFQNFRCTARYIGVIVMATKLVMTKFKTAAGCNQK
jgi:hypothetical protein